MTHTGLYYFIEEWVLGMFGSRVHLFVLKSHESLTQPLSSTRFATEVIMVFERRPGRLSELRGSELSDYEIDWVYVPELIVGSEEHVPIRTALSGSTLYCRMKESAAQFEHRGYTTSRYRFLLHRKRSFGFLLDGPEKDFESVLVQIYFAGDIEKFCLNNYAGLNLPELTAKCAE